MNGADQRIPVGVLGATGSVGQRMVRLLDGHPWFRVAFLGASSRSAGRPYREAVHWVQDGPIPGEVAEMEVRDVEPGLDAPLVLSALDSSVAGEVERRFADAGALVVSNAKNHRMDPDVPLLIPEVNGDHLALLDSQSGGGIVTNPNCSTIGLALSLKPLHDAFGVHSVHVVTLQAVSGGGIPGVASMEILDNVVPYIGGEEEKLELETGKILGTLSSGTVAPARIQISAQCNRVPVIDGHLECVSVGFSRDASPEEAARVLSEFQGATRGLNLPSAPRRPIHVLTGEADPQPRLHRDLDRGMAVSVGRIRPCPLLSLRYVLLSHNTIRGAAGGALLGAELVVARGRLAGYDPPGT
ncbi:MAG: aspartate-semialdehyde dehydrogenase [Gemmatimonadota bacterium]